MEPKTLDTTWAYQLTINAANEAILAFDEDSSDQTDSLQTVDQSSTTTEIPHSDRNEEQLLVFNCLNNRFTFPLPQSELSHQSNITHADWMTLGDLPVWRIENGLICHYRYAPEHIAAECNLPMQRVKM